MDRISKVIERLNDENVNKKGIYLYIPKEGVYAFIETTSHQRFNWKCASHPKKSKDSLDILSDLP